VPLHDAAAPYSWCRVHLAAGITARRLRRPENSVCLSCAEYTLARRLAPPVRARYFHPQ